MFSQERHAQPIQLRIQPSLDLQDHLHKVNKNQSQGKILIFKFSSMFEPNEPVTHANAIASGKPF